MIMNPLDKIVAQSVRDVLEKDLGRHTYKKIEKEILDTYGISVLDAISDFAKFDLVLRKFFGNHAAKLESRIFKKVIVIEKKGKDEPSILIKNPNTAKMIFEAYGDPVKKIIMEMLLKQPKSIPEAISQSKLPQASTYRRAKELIQEGLLTMAGHTKAIDGRKVTEYATTLNRAIFDVQDKGLSVSIKLQGKFLKDSFVFNSISER
ncbi:MAG: hypothetical protein ACR2LL_07700 [Nitrosopumilus sp.]